MFSITRRSPLDSTFRDLVELMGREPIFEASQFGEEGTLPLDVVEKDGQLVIRASLPGFRKEDIDVQIHNGVLSIKAEHTEQEETTDERYYRRERRFGSVSRRIALPGVVSDAAADAELKDGVLTIRIPQAEVVRPKQISIK